MSTRLIAIRHGESTGNVARIATSALDGYPLTALGLAQAAEAAEILAGSSIEHVYSSRVQRARETAAILADRLAIPLTIADGLEEIAVGVHEGRPEAEVHTSSVRNFERWLVRGELWFGFEGGETAEQVAVRTGAALVELAARHPGGTLAVVSHGGALAFALTRLCGNLAPQFVRRHLLHNCAMVEVAVDGDRWTCNSWAGVVPGLEPGLAG